MIEIRRIPELGSSASPSIAATLTEYVPPLIVCSSASQSDPVTVTSGGSASTSTVNGEVVVELPALSYAMALMS